MIKSKRIIAYILSLTLLACMCAVFAGCSNDETIKKMQQQIEELQTQINETNGQQEIIEDLKTQIDGQQEIIDQQKNKINEIEKKNGNLTYRVEELEQQAYGGKFYGLAAAYNKGFLTSEDLQVIANYHSGKVKNEEVLNEDVAASIKRAWAARNGTTADNVSILIYYGTYNECVVVIADRKDAIHVAVYSPISVEIGGVAFTFNYYGPQVTVWKIYNEIGG